MLNVLHVIILYCQDENLQIWDYSQEEINLKGSYTDHKSTIQLTVFFFFKIGLKIIFWSKHFLVYVTVL